MSRRHFTNLTISHNQFTNLPCCNNSAPLRDLFRWWRSIQQHHAMLSNTTVTWNVIGADINSCETPTTGAMENRNGSMDVAGNCTAMRVVSSVNGLVFENNKIVHIGEGVAFACPSSPGGKYPCEPRRPLAAVGGWRHDQNVTARYNDFAGCIALRGKNSRIKFWGRFRIQHLTRSLCAVLRQFRPVVCLLRKWSHCPISEGQ